MKEKGQHYCVPMFHAGNCDLVSCKLVLNEKTTQHFLVFKDTEFILVDPHKTKLGAGIVHFIAFLQVQRVLWNEFSCGST